MSGRFVGVPFYGALLLVSFPLCAQTMNEFPRREDPLSVRVEMFDKLMRGNHWNEGTMMQHVIFPPVGKETPIVGSQADCAFYTGAYLATLSFRYAVTQDPEVRAWADTTMGGILRLEQVTGVSGCVARSFNKTDTPLWHEQAYFFPLEWHASEAMPGYRWLGDLSMDQLTGLIFGTACYWEFCADEEHKKAAEGFVDRVMERCVSNNFRIVDVDEKMTLWGNFCPDLPHENLNALIILSHLKTAFRMTGKQAYAAARDRLIKKYHYDEQALMAKVLWPVEWRNTYDDRLAAMAYYHLMRGEENAGLRRRYRMSLNRHWFLWKDGNDPFYPMLYQALTDEAVVNDKTIEQLKAMWGFERNKGTFTVPGPEGPRQMEAEEEGNSVLMELTYWFGRHCGVVDPAW